MSLTGTDTLISSVQKNVKVNSQLMRVGRGRNAERSWERWMVMNVSNIRPVTAKFNPIDRSSVPETVSGPRSLQTNKDVQQSAQQHVLLDDVYLEICSCPTQAHVEIDVSVEVVWSLEHVMISDGEHNNVKNQENRTSCRSRSVARNLEVLCYKNGSPDLVDDV